MDHGFIVYPTYDLRGEDAIVQLYGRLETGETFLAEVPYEPYFFIAQEDVQAAKEIISLDVNETDLKTLDGQPVASVHLSNPRDMKGVRDQLHEASISTYEADVRFAYRFLIDHNITGDVAIKGEYTKGETTDRFYEDPELLPGNWQGKLVTLSFDIETDFSHKKLLSVALTTGDREEKLIIDREVDGAHNCKDEPALLAKLNAIIDEIDPDIITGWNCIDFDLKVLQDMYRKHDIPWNWGRADRDVRLRIMSDFMRDSSADIPGRQVLDGIHLLKNSFIKLDSYSLENASQELLGDGKVFKGKSRGDKILDAYNNNPEELLDYNLKDAQLVLDIIEKTDVLNLTIERSRITGMQLERVSASIASLDMMYLPRLRGRGHVAPTSGGTRKTHGITGGYVMDSKPGIYDYVIVCDFKSLYPSVMRTLNIDPLAFNPKEQSEQSTKEFIRAENGALFAREEGILPGILTELWNEREAARKQGNELARYAIKILMNSFFGVLASPNCRFFSMEIGNAITHSAQHFIKTTAEKIREQGYEVIYGDTDSIFLDLKVKTREDAQKIGKKVQDDMNAFLEGYVTKRYAVESHLELEFEKTYTRFLMPMTRSGEGSKKRYAGLIEKNGEEKMDFTGLEFVRRDWTDLAKEFQLTILDKIFHHEDPQEYIKAFVDEVRDGKHDDLLVYRKALRKKLEDYTKTTPPHVKAARLMDEITDNVIQYIQTVDGPEPVGKVQHSVDYEHYIDKQLKPIADSVLVFYDTNFDDVLKGTSQKGLFEF